MSEIVLVIMALVVLTGAAAFLALAETALTRLSPVKVAALQEEGHRGAGALGRLLDDPSRALNPILLLVLVCHLAAATIVGAAAADAFGAVGLTAAAVAEIVVIFVVAEAAPKTFAIEHPERAALLVAPVVEVVARLWPVRVLTSGLIALARRITPGATGQPVAPFVSAEDLRAMADVAADDEVIEVEERRLIHSIMEFGDTVAREVMVPRPDMVTADAASTVADVLGLVINKGFSRIPITGENVDDIVGLAYAKDLMRAARDEGGDQAAVSELVRSARFVPETKRVSELMKEMQAAQFHMAIVVDEYGGTAGLVTLEDLIEELVGEIVDEFDVEDPLVEPLPAGEVRVDARLPIDELNELLHAELPTGDWDTVGGLLFNLLGHVPYEGETVLADGHRLTAEKVKGRRIGKVRISRVDQPPLSDPASG
jgi:CBS domain containing-hemolysin-like protein